MSRTSREVVANVLKHVKDFYANVFAKICRKTVARLSGDNSMTFVRVSRTCRRKSLENLQCENFTTLVRLSYNCRTTVARQS